MQFFGILDDVEKVSTEIPLMVMYKLPGGKEVLKKWDMLKDADASTSPSAPYVSRLRSSLNYIWIQQ